MNTPDHKQDFFLVVLKLLTNIVIPADDIFTELSVTHKILDKEEYKK